jgi:hypothetical protein
LIFLHEIIAAINNYCGKYKAIKTTYLNIYYRCEFNKVYDNLFCINNNEVIAELVQDLDQQIDVKCLVSSRNYNINAHLYCYIFRISANNIYSLDFIHTQKLIIGIEIMLEIIKQELQFFEVKHIFLRNFMQKFQCEDLKTINFSFPDLLLVQINFYVSIEIIKFFMFECNLVVYSEHSFQLSMQNNFCDIISEYENNKIITQDGCSWIKYDFTDYEIKNEIIARIIQADVKLLKNAYKALQD